MPRSRKEYTNSEDSIDHQESVDRDQYVRQKKPRNEKKPILNLILAINVDKKIIKSWGQF